MLCYLYWALYQRPKVWWPRQSQPYIDSASHFSFVSSSKVQERLWTVNWSLSDVRDEYFACVSLLRIRFRGDENYVHEREVQGTG